MQHQWSLFQPSGEFPGIAWTTSDHSLEARVPVPGQGSHDKRSVLSMVQSSCSHVPTPPSHPGVLHKTVAVVQSLSLVWLCDPMDCNTPGSQSFSITRACSDSHPLSQWCHPTTSSSVIPFSSCPQSFPASRSLPKSWLFPSGGQSIGASTSVLLNEYSGLISFRVDWFDLLPVQGTLKSLL